MGIYVWHMTGLALCAAVIAVGLHVPERLTTAWWLTRPLWWAAVLAVASGFVALTAAARARLTRGRTTTAAISARRALTGVAVAAGAAAYVGLRGPGSATRAIICSMLFVAAWLLLRPGHTPPGAPPARSDLSPEDEHSR